MANKLITNLTPTARVGMSSIYRMSDAPPNWAQDDPTQPDYIKNKEEAEKLRPIYVNGQQILDDTHESGPLNLVEGENVHLSIADNGNSVIISATQQDIPDILPEEYRPILVEGQEILDKNNSGGLNLKGGKNVQLFVEGNDVYITATGGGEGPGSCDCLEIVEGEGIDVTETPYGQKVVSLEKGAITDDYIGSISMSKLVQDQGIKLVLNGGNANG